MKHSKITIQIPEPCHEDWNQMSATDKGKFCHVCTKEVIDFTSKSDAEIIKHFTDHGNLCGRFHVSQLNRKLIADRKKRNHWLSYAATLLLPLTVFSQQEPIRFQKAGKAQATANSNFISLQIGSQPNKSVIHQKDSIPIKGVVIDEVGTPFPGVSIKIKGTKTEVLTDFDGNFTLKAKTNDVLQISYFGYENQEITIVASKEIYNSILKPKAALEAITGYGYYIKPKSLTHLPEKVDPEDITTIEEQKKSFFQKLQNTWKQKLQNIKKKH
ncbi:TonB-dependent receptor SusC [Kordia sp. SMS9]|uniref:carboxypeptidase-like regulatory domain-containing protein n=1 Tax=Kordia sp. SMS9 TaxID=2282170 RepID=UPI000E10E2D3|nr:carboxypeptidase-like regulatory domain-containing protein [Kordia sp. SMS9]AXG71030.1 TonB-dependent receptor SusC [Kordia sp. SMS9]